MLGRARPRSLSWNAARDAQEGRRLVPGCEAGSKQTKRSVQNVTDADFTEAVIDRQGSATGSDWSTMYD